MNQHKQHNAKGEPAPPTKYDLPILYRSVSPAQRREVRDQYVAEQGGDCPFCYCALSGPPEPVTQTLHLDPERLPPGFFRHPVHLHHDHETGLTISAVHARCNAILFQYFGQ